MSGRKNIAFYNIAIFVVLLLALTIFPSFFRQMVSRTFEQFRAPIETLPSHMSDLATYWSLNANSKRSLMEAGRDLARLNSMYEIKIAENASLRDEIKHYKKLLKIPSYDKYNWEIARVVRHDLSAWWQRIVIRKGSMHGVKKGCAVIYGGGVVGRVVSVNATSSTVELVSSVNFRMAAFIEGDDRPIIYQGAGAWSFRDPKGEVSDVPSDIKSTFGNPVKLYTSDLAGTFPSGLLIGEIINLKFEPDGIFQTGHVRLSGSLANIREVVILIPVEPSGGVSR